MKDIAIYGANGFGREMALLLQQINQQSDRWNLIGFFDDGIPPNSIVDALPVLGGLKEVNEYKGPLDLVLGIADPMIRSSLLQKIVNKTIHYPSLIHPRAITGSPSNLLGRGCVIQAGVIMTTGITLEEFVVVQGTTTIGHDAHLGAFTIIMPGCSISGNVRIGSRTLVGTGARILQNLRLGEGCVVGAGAVVTKSFPDTTRMIGVPAKPI